MKTTRGECCVFPSVYQRKSFYSCRTVDYGSKLWCATTNSYDKDKKRGDCQGRHYSLCSAFICVNEIQHGPLLRISNWGCFAGREGGGN